MFVKDKSCFIMSFLTISGLKAIIMYLNQTSPIFLDLREKSLGYGHFSRYGREALNTTLGGRGGGLQACISVK